MDVLERAEYELEMQDRVIKAAEDWSSRYTNLQDNLANLIIVESRIQRLMRKYFRELADVRSENYINWFMYNDLLARAQASRSIKAYNFDVDVIISDEMIDLEDKIIVDVLHDQLALAAYLGAQSGELTYIPIGLSESSVVIQRTAQQTIAELVGKTVQLNKDGSIKKIVNNKNAKYRISDVTRKNIRESIRVSLELRENTPDAITRMKKVIKDAKRAEMIAQTESVNAYQKGLFNYGLEAGAIGKAAESQNTEDICATNENAGPIPLDQPYPSGQMHPAFHPRCRCTQRLVFAESSEAKLVNKN